MTKDLDGSNPVEIYKHWLLECVLIRGWTTIKCAREIGVDPRRVRWDFERFLRMENVGRRKLPWNTH